VRGDRRAETRSHFRAGIASLVRATTASRSWRGSRGDPPSAPFKLRGARLEVVPHREAWDPWLDLACYRM